MNRVERFLNQIAGPMLEKAKELPDKSWVDILTMLKITYGQSKEGIVNNYDEDILVYDNGLTIRKTPMTMWKYESAMYSALRQQQDFFVDPSSHIMKYVGWIHRSLLRRYDDIYKELEQIEAQVDSKCNIKFKELQNSPDSYAQKVYYIPKGKSLQIVAEDSNVWIIALQGFGHANAHVKKCMLYGWCEYGKQKKKKKGTYVCFRRNRNDNGKQYYAIITNRSEEDLIIYVSFC